jgi:putative hydrolase of the HAD superfamily
MTAYDTVVFDFGGVFTASPFEAVARGSAVSGVDPELALQYVFGSYERDTDHPWHRAERGELTLEEARQQILTDTSAAGHELDVFSLLASMGGAGIRDEMVERVRQLRAEGVRTAMITNNVIEFREYWRAMLPLDELFEVVVDSSEVGMRKPDPRIYALVLDRLGSEPARAIFLDDHPGNIAGAEACGMRGVLVSADYLDAIVELDALLVGSGGGTE